MMAISDYGYNWVDFRVNLISLRIIFLVIYTIITWNLYIHLYIKDHPYQIEPTQFIKNVSFYACICFIIAQIIVLIDYIWILLDFFSIVSVYLSTISLFLYSILLDNIFIFHI